MKEVKGIMHIHSAHSYDGKMELGELRETLIAHGFSFACMTEHTDSLTSGAARTFISECNELSDDKFIFIPGFEVPYLDARVLMIGARKFFGQAAHDVEALLAWREVTPVMILAHPTSNNFQVDDTLQDLIDGVEVWNQRYDGALTLRPRSVRLLEDLRCQNELIATGGIDYHQREHLTGPATYMQVSILDEQVIVDKLTAGEFQFGNQARTFSATESLNVNITPLIRIESALSVAAILISKWKDRILGSFGFDLPKVPMRTVRAGV